MSGPTLAEQLAAVLSARDRINQALLALEAISPDILKGPEEVLRAAIVGAVSALDPVIVGDSLLSVGKVLREGRGIVGGGVDSMTA